MDALAGAMYFIVGRATEGGPSPYHLTIAGITLEGLEPNWGKVEKVAADSGYSIGAIQVDLGKRGTWPLGATRSMPLEPGQVTYVDGLIAQAAQYAEKHHLAFPGDKAKLRDQLLTHGDGKNNRSKLDFIEPDVRDTFNAWAKSEGGQKWIHSNIDYPQIRSATQQALDMLDAVGKNVSENHRLEAVAVLMKTANQRPAELARFRDVLSHGGNYDDMLAAAEEIARHNKSYAGVEAATSAGRYLEAYSDATKTAALDRAQAKVGSVDFNPATFAVDQDLQEALRAIGQGPAIHVLRKGSHGDGVVALQTNLARLGITDAHGRGLQPDGAFGASTREAVVAFQRAHRLKGDGLAGPRTLETLDEAIRQQGVSLADRRHPGHALFCQALEQVHLIDAKCGRTPDELSNNLAGALVTAARGRGLAGIDHVVLGENATRAFAVQGELDSPFRQVAGVDILQAVAKPLAQSSAKFHASAQPVGPHPEGLQHQHVALPAPAQAIRH
ncbi:MAG TPA: peptidoglycan-binding domain-containing protein [Frateuria sp.]|uniref:peptidoglycan-binding domain-containing protein n=1 Tax=Frateuria sp. TaxID=2211372 RepID=UPI002D7EAD4C|nr:peptidoglycan-binding domain-containing protein [Frateuria sp.]HET6807139.1 peptidoglycan-binding domain-containing protein [Frateuria sp.]